LNSFGHRGTSSNLPDWATDKMIDAAFGDEGYEDENEYDDEGFDKDGNTAEQNREAWFERERERSLGDCDRERDDEYDGDR